MIELLLIAALSDWNCRSVSDYAGITAVARDNGVSLAQRVDDTERALLHSGEIDDREFAFLSALARQVYSSNLTPRQLRDTFHDSCVRGRSVFGATGA